jgi:hypothetical protein
MDLSGPSFTDEQYGSFDCEFIDAAVVPLQAVCGSVLCSHEPVAVCGDHYEFIDVAVVPLQAVCGAVQCIRESVAERVGRRQ